VRSASRSRQTRLRQDLWPLGLPSMKGELAKSAVATGCSASATRSFLTMSASDAKSRFTCTVQVRYIIVLPSVPDAVHVIGHQPVAPLGHHRHVLVRPDRGGAQPDEADADPVRHFADLPQVFVHFVAGLVDRLQRCARQLQLPAGLEADIRAVLLEADDVVAFEDRATSRNAAAAPPASRARSVRPRRAAASACRGNSRTSRARSRCASPRAACTRLRGIRPVARAARWGRRRTGDGHGSAPALLTVFVAQT
jgi:hypothetical protein